MEHDSITILFMVITYAGEGHVRLQNGEITVGIDPVSTRAKTTITLRTSCDVDAPFVDDEIFSPGDYERSEVEVSGVATHTQGSTVFTSYLLLWEGIRLLFLANSGDFDASGLGDIGQIDVLFVPADGKNTDVSAVSKFVRGLHPAIVVPVYAKSALELAKALGATPQETDKLVFKKKDLVVGKGDFVVLTPTK